jgi:hypothetical protein
MRSIAPRSFLLEAERDDLESLELVRVPQHLAASFTSPNPSRSQFSNRYSRGLRPNRLGVSLAPRIGRRVPEIVT